MVIFKFGLGVLLLAESLVNREMIVGCHVSEECVIIEVKNIENEIIV